MADTKRQRRREQWATLYASFGGTNEAKRERSVNRRVDNGKRTQRAKLNDKRSQYDH